MEAKIGLTSSSLPYKGRTDVIITAHEILERLQSEDDLLAVLSTPDYSENQEVDSQSQSEVDEAVVNVVPEPTTSRYAKKHHIETQACCQRSVQVC